ncbi:MAG: septum formation initiator family protein [Eubacteriales bacterium]|nr:septum formation initiator family protein [Eubacteriales bacterium]
MLKKRRRSREFKKNSQVVNISEARKERRSKRKSLKDSSDSAGLLEEEKFYEPEGNVTQRKKIRKKRRRWAYIAILLGVVVLVSASLINIVSLRAERAKIQQQNAELAAMKIKLEKQLEEVNNPEYIEAQARTQLRLVRPGEVLYIFSETNLEEDTEGKEKIKDEE